MRHTSTGATRAGAGMALAGCLLLAACQNDNAADAGAGGLATTPPPAATPTDQPGATGSSPSPERAAPTPPDDRLLPDLQSLPPEDVLIEVVGDVRRLRFASIIANVGVGPVETTPDDEAPCPDDQRHASQVIYHDVDGDGQYTREVDTRTTTRPAGCMLDHPGHDHWHFDTAARYALTDPGSTEAIVAAEKVSFCWRDNREVPAEADPRPDQFYGDCAYDDVQGITPGWADVYGEHLDDQHLDLPDDLADGVYCLWNEADPLGLLVESDDSNNAGVLAIEITGTDVAEADDVRCD